MVFSLPVPTLDTIFSILILTSKGDLRRNRKTEPMYCRLSAYFILREKLLQKFQVVFGRISPQNGGKDINRFLFSVEIRAVADVPNMRLELPDDSYGVFVLLREGDKCNIGSSNMPLHTCVCSAAG